MNQPAHRLLSIVIPVYNEEESLPQLHREIAEVCKANAIPIEILFVDDGSTDSSWNVIRNIKTQDARVQGIRFRRNFGKAAALSAGLQQAKGELIFTLDADLQDDPQEIPRALAKIAEGFDVINGWKKHRLDPWHKVYPSKVFNAMVSRLTGLSLHDHNCGLKCFRREVGQEIRLYGELHRFIPVLAHARGFKVAELDIHHRPRQFGHSKYGIRRFLRGFLDLLTVKFLTAFGQRPQHALGALGMCAFALGGIGMAYLALVWLLTNLGGFEYAPIGNRPLLGYSVATLLLGGQLLTLGLLAELVVANTNSPRESYSVAERV